MNLPTGPLRWSAPLLAASSPMMVFALLRTWDGMDRLAMYPAEHFWIVSATALLSGMIGTALAISVQSVRTTRTVYLALGFIAVALIFATHGLGTPGYIVELGEDPNAVVISAGLSQFVGSVFIAMSILPASAPGARLVRDHASTLFGAAMVLLAAYVATMVWRPEYWDFIPQGHGWETSLATLTMVPIGHRGMAVLSRVAADGVARPAFDGAGTRVPCAGTGLHVLGRNVAPELVDVPRPAAACVPDARRRLGD